jgi:hypothetical protein
MGKIDINDESTWPDCQCWVHLNDGTWRKYAIPNGVIWSSRHDNGAFFHGCSWFPCGPRGWIRVDDGLPELGDKNGFLILDGKMVSCADKTNNGWLYRTPYYSLFASDVTAWQPAPGAPVGEEG